jgi:hypothetical protein
VGSQHGVAWGIVGAIAGAVIGFATGPIIVLVLLFVAHLECTLTGKVKAKPQEQEEDGRPP